MLSLRGIGHCLILLALMSSSGGCFQTDNHGDDEQDPHFQRGRNLASGQDFKGAAQEFETALETNPRSAAAHFELGWIYDNKLNDYAAAIYHYEQHLRLQPDSPRAALVKERIRGCKQQLANTEFPMPSSRNLQRDVDRLTADNQSLKQQLEALKVQLAFAQNAVQTRADPVRYTTSAPGQAPQGQWAQTGVTPLPSHGRVHLVKPGETISAIATLYGMKASEVLAANPQINPRRLRVGQSVNLP